MQRHTFITVFAVLFLLPSFASAQKKSARESYASAKEIYLALLAEKSPKRHQFEKAIEAFRSIAQQYPSSPEAPKALYNVGSLYRKLYAISRRGSDAEAAKEAFLVLADAYPKSTLADDALLFAAELTPDEEEAEALLEILLERYPDGDQREEARRRLKKGEKPPPKKSPKSAAPPPSEGKKLASAKSATEKKAPTAQPKQENNSPRASAAERAARKAAEKAALTLEKKSLSWQAGLGIRKVIIDPGHGGEDTGGKGASSGAEEKEIALTLATLLCKELKERALECALTREKDVALSQEERAKRAKELGGDLFISLHTNAARDPSLSGLSAYVLDITGGDPEAIQAARRESVGASGGTSDLRDLLEDIATRSDAADAREVARLILEGATAAARTVQPRAKNRGVGGALFGLFTVVKMPAVLVDVAFLTNPEEELLLSDPSYRHALAEGMAEGILAYLSARQ